MSDPQASIGIFDSGIGGLTVMDAIRKQLSNENLIYLGDTARVPYGNRTPQTIIRYAMGCSRILTSRNIKALVIACNTASAHALSALQEALPIPVFGVIRPVSEYAAGISKNHRIGIIGTRATVSSGAYRHTIQTFAPDALVFDTPCPLFVPLVEEGWAENDISLRVAGEYLRRFQDTGIDTMILGCTHYPVLRNAISAVLAEMGLSVTLCDCGYSTSIAVKQSLEANRLLNPSPDKGHSTFLVTDDPEGFARVASTFISESIHSVEHVDF